MKSLFLLLTMAVCLYANAQSTQTPQKIGHADWEYIFSRLPEYKKIENELKSFEAQLQNQLKLKSQELETKYKAYTELPANTPEAIKKTKKPKSLTRTRISRSSGRKHKYPFKKNRMT